MAAGSFAFGFALVPLYDVFCEVTGIGTRAELSRAATADVSAPDLGRTVVVEFTASVPDGGRWEFAAGRRIDGSASWPPLRGALYARAISRIAKRPARPCRASHRSAPPSYFRKTECFCFTPQQFARNEQRELLVRFVVDRDLPPGIDRLTLSYAFYDVARVAGGAG